MNKRAMSKAGVSILSILVVLAIGVIAFLATGHSFSSLSVAPSSSLSVANVSGGVGTPASSNLGNFQATATYAVKDKFSTATVSGTSYYKADGTPATTTAISNVQPGVQYMYWVDNNSYYVQPVTFTAVTGTQNLVANAWANESGSITGYDTKNHQSTTGGAYNTTLGANANAYEQFTYTGVAKKSSGPFGGLMVLEYNSSISSVTCTGDNILPAGSVNPYHLTYTTTATTHTYQEWVYTSGFDDGTGTLQTINCQFTNGNTAIPTNDSYVLTFYPANYYIGNDGNFYLDTSEYANGNPGTLTSLNQPTATFYWG